MTFSWGFLFLSKHLDSIPTLIFSSAVIAILFTLLFKIVFKGLKKIESPDGVAVFNPTVGLTGKVYITVHANSKSGGQVIFEDVNLGSYTLNVLNKNNYNIQTGELVIIESIDEGNNIYVSPVNKEYFENKNMLKQNVKM